jgi:hypothetical protein
MTNNKHRGGTTRRWDEESQARSARSHGGGADDLTMHLAGTKTTCIFLGGWPK